MARVGGTLNSLFTFIAGDSLWLVRETGDLFPYNVSNNWYVIKIYNQKENCHELRSTVCTLLICA